MIFLLKGTLIKINEKELEMLVVELDPDFRLKLTH